jgi:hypothetical protein
MAQEIALSHLDRQTAQTQSETEGKAIFNRQQSLRDVIVSYHAIRAWMTDRGPDHTDWATRLFYFEVLRFIDQKFVEAYGREPSAYQRAYYLRYLLMEKQSRRILVSQHTAQRAIASRMVNATPQLSETTPIGMVHRATVETTPMATTPLATTPLATLYQTTPQTHTAETHTAETQTTETMYSWHSWWNAATYWCTGFIMGVSMVYVVDQSV